MKKKPLSRLVAMLLTALVPLLSPAVNTIIYNATYDFNELTLGTDTLGGVTYTTVNYEGLYNGGDPGKPSLPIDYIKLSVPYNATNFTVTATLQNNVIQTLGNLDQLVYPCQPARMMNDTTPVVIVPPDSSVYFSSSYYPGQNAWVVDEGFLAGENHIVTIAVMPVSYKHNRTGNITTNRLRKSQTVRLTLSYSLTDNPAMSPIIRQDTTLRQEGYALTRSMVANPSNVLANAPIELSIDPMDIVNPNSGDGLNGGVEPPGPVVPPDSVGVIDTILQKKIYPYLIVTTPELKHSVRRIAALKRQKGYAVKIVTMNDVMSDPNAILGDRFKQPDGSYYVAYNDDAGKLRQYLKNAYRYWGTQYVLLAGDSVPYRKIIGIPTDLYYCDLTGKWDSVKNIEKDPEVFVGRLIAKSQHQINNYTEKLFRYELNPGRGDRSYLKRALYTESSDMIGKSEYERYYFDSIYTDTIIREIMWEEIPTGTSIINEINSTQYGFLSFHNHAGPSAIITYGFNRDVNPNDYHYRLHWLWAIDSVHIYDSGYADHDTENHNGLNNLTNKWYPSIFYTIGCMTMPYDVVQKYENIPMNFGESFTTGKDYGGPVFIGNTRDGYALSSAKLERLFAEQIYSQKTQVGIAEALSKLQHTELYINLVNNLLGDPELDMWTDVPQEYQSINISRTDNSVTISGIDIANTIVSCCNNDGVIIRKSATSNVVNLSEMAPNASVMLYRHNCIPFIVPMVLQNTTLKKSQYVVASDFTAGFSVDSDRTSGDVIVKNGVEYEVEASGTVTLRDGFKVEKGAFFSVIPSTF